jgi:hypothetical protein
VLRCKTHAGALPKDGTVSIFILPAHVEVLSHDETSARAAATTTAEP